MTNIPKRRKQIAMRPDANRAWLQNQLLNEIGNTGTYRAAIVADLRPLYKACLPEGESRLSLSGIEMQIFDSEDLGNDVSKLTAYTEALNQFVSKTLGLTYQGEAAQWVLQAIHDHIAEPRLSSPVIAHATFPFWREISVNVHVDDFHARAEVIGHDGQVAEAFEIEAPFMTVFDQWGEFMQQACSMFIGQLEAIRAEMGIDLDESEAFRRIGGLQHQQESIKRIARLNMMPRHRRNAALRSDLGAANERSEKEHIRTVSDVIGLDSPFIRKQKK